MSKASVRAEINKLQREINTLEDKKTSYENMNVKINKAIGELTNAKNSTQKAYQGLGGAYKSKIANEKVLELEDEYTNISNVIKTLQGEILQASNNKINDISNNISRNQREISRLRKKLATMKDE